MLLSLKRGRVTKIIQNNTERQDLLVTVNNSEEPTINYTLLTGKAKVGDEVVINTTAVELGLGTGGRHFVLYNLSGEKVEIKQTGHIMKLRYTPMQIKVMAAEEQESPYHHLFETFNSLENMPVLLGTLHSMLTPAVTTLKYLKPKAKIAYIMTDAAALPIYLSNAVQELKSMGMIDKTITIGHAFGGDIETVNIYNGLIAAKEITKCDVAIVTMGPGIVGTGTSYGFTGVEQGNIIDAVNDLGGSPIVMPRISFADQRERHRGLSHHSITILARIAKTQAQVVIPQLDLEKRSLIFNQIDENQLANKHYIHEIEGNIIEQALSKFQMSVQTMGRNYKEDKEFFLACSAAGVYTASLLDGDRCK